MKGKEIDSLAELLDHARGEQRPIEQISNPQKNLRGKMPTPSKKKASPLEKKKGNE